MSVVLPSWPLLSAFLIASVALAVTPGPGVLYVVSSSVLQGARSGFASVAGVALGNLGNALGASVGLAALFAMSSVAFIVVKYAGAAYLIYLGLRTLRGPHAQAAEPARAVTPHSRVFRDGFFVALLNPKTALFFAAFLPQFMSAHASGAAQSAVLGALFVAIAVVTDSIYVLAASRIAPRLACARAGRRVSRFLSGATFIGLGLLTAVGTRNAK